MKTNNVEGTVWPDVEKKEERIAKQFQESGVFDKMELIFAANKTVAKKVEKPKEVIRLLPSKSIYIIEVRLINMKRNHDEIRTGILKCDPEICTPEFLADLVKIIPTDDIRTKLKPYMNTSTEEFNKLGKAEQFFVMTENIPRYADRIKALHYKATFDEAMKNFDETCTQVEKAAKRVNNSDSFKRLVSLVLALGNFLNAKGPKGGAVGFALGDLLKLGDTKAASDVTPTFLHFLTTVVEDEEFMDDLAYCGEAAKYSTKELADQLRKLQRERKTCAELLDADFTLNGTVLDNDRFVPTMKSFLDSATNKLAQAQRMIDQAQLCYGTTRSMYSLPEPVQSNELFEILAQFIKQYDKARKEVKQFGEEHSRKERAEQMRKERATLADAKRAAKAATTDTGPANSDNDVDDLLGKLRRGAPGTPGRKARRMQRSTSGKGRDVFLDHANDLIEKSRAEGEAGDASSVLDLTKNMLERLKLDVDGGSSSLADSAASMLASLRDDSSIEHRQENKSSSSTAANLLAAIKAENARDAEADDEDEFADASEEFRG